MRLDEYNKVKVNIIFFKINNKKRCQIICQSETKTGLLDSLITFVFQSKKAVINSH